MKGPDPQLPPDSDEHLLQLITEAKQKLMLLKEDLEGKNLATIMEEMEEVEFLTSIARKIPQYNTRIQPLEALKLDPFDKRDRSAYFESSHAAIKKNREKILDLRQENKNLRMKLAENDEQVIKDVVQDHGVKKASFRNLPVKAARAKLEKQAFDKKKKLNAMKHTTQKQRQLLEDLKLQYQRLNPHSKSPLPDTQKREEEEKELRILENRLEKMQLKCQEVEHIIRIYLKLKDHLQEESLTYQPQLDRLEAEIHQQTQVLKDLQVMKSDAYLSKDANKADLQLQEEQAHRERKQRETVLSRYKKQTLERMNQAERMKRRPQWATVHPDELSSEAQRSVTAVGEEGEIFSTFEEAFQRIKEATRVTDPYEIEDRFISQGQTQEHLEKMKAENERMLLELKEERNSVQTQLQEMKYSRKTELSSMEENLQESEHHLEKVQKRRNESKDDLDRLTQTLTTVRAGVQQFSDKLQHIPLMKGPDPQLPPDSDEHLLQLITEAKQKLMLLKEDLEGQNLGTIIKDIEEEEFLTSIARKIPQYNTRIQPLEALKLDPFDDEDSSDDEGDVITRASLKHQSQTIIDANTKRKTRIKKRKSKL